MTQILTSKTSTTGMAQHKGTDDIIDERLALTRFARLKSRVKIQTWIIVVLVGLFVLILPFAQPINLYYAMSPDKKTARMAGLSMPNLTNRAVLSWATTSITEVMTMGFGDMDTRLPKQRIRFTKDGWNSFVKAFVNEKIGEKFKQNQLVLTTAPADTPVIVAQGLNLDNVYQWVVQMPVIMTYATNNNVTNKNRAIVTLTLIRVPSEESVDGIGIDNWAQQ